MEVIEKCIRGISKPRHTAQITKYQTLLCSTKFFMWLRDFCVIFMNGMNVKFIYENNVMYILSYNYTSSHIISITK